MNQAPIGFFDTGVGGLSVLRSAQAILPKEDFIFLADLKNAPYGSKTQQEIQALTKSNVEYLISLGIKALVIACNTATSAAAKALRAQYKMPIIGLEPAIKPAIEKSKPNAPILVMATPATLNLDKYLNLVADYDHSRIHEIPCGQLSRLIETAKPGSEEINTYLGEKLESYQSIDDKSVVIGCTHFSFVSQDIQSILGKNRTSIYDGREGAAKQLKRVLEQNDMLNDNGGDIKLISTAGDHSLRLLEKFMTEQL